MHYFRIHTAPSDDPGSRWKGLFWGGLTLLIVGSFLLQMSMGLCPVPG